MFAGADTHAVRGRRRRSSNWRGESSLQKEPDDRRGAKQQQVEGDVEEGGSFELWFPVKG
jgi:hypothetical protein